MNRATTFVTGAISGAVAWASWRYYRSRAATQVEYETRRLCDGIEIRQYPTVIVAETVAESISAARRRLRSYLTGANEIEIPIPTTTPIRIHTESLEVVTPTGSRASTDPVRVGVYLPPSYSPQTAPKPTNNEVLLTVETTRTVAVRSVPWYRRADRVERAETQLLTALADNDLVAVGSPFVFTYNNSIRGSLTGQTEVAIEVA
jgi:hypothetical protein